MELFGVKLSVDALHQTMQLVVLLITRDLLHVFYDYGALFGVLNQLSLVVRRLSLHYRKLSAWG